jgi:hypothetical protein
VASTPVEIVRRRCWRHSGSQSVRAAASAASAVVHSSRPRRQPRHGRQHGQVPQRARGGAAQLDGGLAVKALQRDAVACRRAGGERTHQRPGAERRGDGDEGPARCQAQAQPRRDQQQQRGRRHEAAAQVVQHLPDVDGAQAPASRVADEGQQLPVATRPAVDARGGHVGMHGRGLDERHVADAGAAHQRALQQVVAEHLALGQAVGQHLRGGLHVDQALAGGAALVEEVLVDLGAGGAVRVQPRLAGEQAVEPGAVHRGAAGGGGQRRGDARLQHAVAVHDGDGAIGRGGHARAVQWMGGDGRELAQRAGRQRGVAVQRDDVADARGRRGQLTQVDEAVGQGLGRRAGCRRGQQRNERLGLAALAFPADPALLGLAPAALAVQQQEARQAAAGRAVARVQRLDAGLRLCHQPVILRQLLGLGVAEVAEQRELGLGLQVGEVVALQLGQQRRDALGPRQHAGNDDQRA